MYDDPVIDYMVMEAVAVRVANEDAAAMEKQKAESWKRDTSSLDHLR